LENIYIVRHCEAQGQPPEARLTEKGLQQANELAAFFADKKIDRIITSPYKRAIDTMQPFATKVNVEIELDERLTERVLSTKNLPDWLEKLEASFEDLDLKYDDGESSREAMNRIVEVVDDVINTDDHQNTIIVTHGNLMSLLLKHFNQEFGFEEWKNLRNPDVYLLNHEKGRVTQLEFTVTT